jgi:tetratricopeptide (TPR) repeat protein
MSDPNAILREAFARHQGGAPAVACGLYRQVLAVRPADPDALHLLGVACAATGKVAEGIALIRRAVAAQPVFPSAHFNLGSLLLGQGEAGAALASLNTCIVQAPQRAGALATAGRALLALDRLGEAVTAFDRALHVAPDPTCWNDLGVALQRSGRPDDALRAYAEALQLRPVYADAQFNRGCLLLARSDLDEAEAAFEAALVAQPDHVGALWSLGLIRATQGRSDDALSVLDRLLALAPSHLLALAPSHLLARKHRAALLSAAERTEEAVADLTAVLDAEPDDVEMLTGRAGLLRTLDRLEEADRDLERALSIAPDHVGALVERANVAQDRLDYDVALAGYDLALARHPDDVAALVNRGAVLRAMGRSAEALAAWRQALVVEPERADVMLNVGLCLLQMGDWTAGWQAHEARLRRSPWHEAIAGYTVPQWDGRATLDGRRLLLVSEQGLGDAIQFSRFARLAAERGATVILGVDQSLRRLMTGLEGVAEVSCPGDPDAGAELFCPLLSLPARLGLTLDDAAMQVPYLRADPVSVAGWRGRLAGLAGRKVGLVWAGNPRFGNLMAPRMDLRRSVALERLAPLLAVPGITFVSLQKGEAGAQAAGSAVLDWTDELDDFADTAALIEALDLVISVDTSVAHAAGALGRPVWVLNRFDRCWRWMTERTDTPWYPTMRLFTQSRPGVWDDVVDAVVAALARF